MKYHIVFSIVAVSAAMCCPSVMLATPVVFYVDAHGGPTVHVGRVNSDGTNHQVLYSSAGGAGFGIDVDPVNQHIYWTEFATNTGGWRIRRSDFNGSGIVDLVTPTNDPDLTDITGLSLDLPNGEMYWVQRSNGKIKKADLTGANVSTVLQNLDRPWGIEVDSVSTGKMYFATRPTSAATRGLMRADLNGSNQQLLFQPPPSAWVNGVTIDPDINNPKVYFTTEKNGPSGDVYSINPNGTNVITLPVPAPSGLLFGIDVLPTTNALDPLFWAEKTTSKLHQSLTDGSQYQVLLNTPSLAGDVAVIQFVIPEPSTSLLLVLGLGGVAVRRKTTRPT